MQPIPPFGLAPFPEAAKAWLETRKPYVGDRTYADYEKYIETLERFFGKKTLANITADDIREYQQRRLTTAGASCINHECSALQQMLKRTGLWDHIVADYQPLPLPKESPHRALTMQEEERLYRVGAANPNWDVAYCAYVISINTTCGPGEIRHIRLCDVDQQARMMRVQPEGATNAHRIRAIPLNQPAWRAIEYLLKRAARIGSVNPEHYLIPFRLKRNSYDPTRPAKGWRTALREMLAAADIKLSAYSFRHHAITKLLENPDVSEEAAEALAGHISHQIKRRYSHIRMEVKRAAVEALENIGRPRKITAQKKRQTRVTEIMNTTPVPEIAASRRGGRPSKEKLYGMAEILFHEKRKSWPQCAEILIPGEVQKNGRHAAGESLRVGVARIEKKRLTTHVKHFADSEWHRGA